MRRSHRFFELTWDVSDVVTVTAGARYTDETKESVFSQPYVHPDGTLALGWIEGAVPADQDFDEFSPEATISWQVNDEINLYSGVQERIQVRRILQRQSYWP